MTTRACGCLTRGVTAVDQDRHAAWHELVGPEVAGKQREAAR